MKLFRDVKYRTDYYGSANSDNRVI